MLKSPLYPSNNVMVYRIELKKFKSNNVVVVIMLIPVWLHGVCDRWVIAFQTTGVRIPDTEFSSSTFVTGLTKVQVCISKKTKLGVFDISA